MQDIIICGYLGAIFGMIMAKIVKHYKGSGEYKIDWSLGQWVIVAIWPVFLIGIVVVLLLALATIVMRVFGRLLSLVGSIIDWMGMIGVMCISYMIDLYKDAIMSD